MNVARKPRTRCLVQHPTETYTVGERIYGHPPNLETQPVYCTSPIDNGNHRHSQHVGLSHKLTRISWER